MDIGKIQLPPQPWTCPNCRTIWAPHVDFCKNCDKTESGSDKKLLLEVDTGESRKLMPASNTPIRHVNTAFYSNTTFSYE